MMTHACSPRKVLLIRGSEIVSEAIFGPQIPLVSEECAGLSGSIVVPYQE